MGLNHPTDHTASVSGSTETPASKVILAVPLWPFIVAVTFLTLALPSGWPYGFYKLLRWLTCAVAFYGAFHAHKQNRNGLKWSLVGIALLFNPFLPIHLPKAHWRIIDIITAILLGIAALILRKPPQSKREGL